MKYPKNNLSRWCAATLIIGGASMFAGCSDDDDNNGSGSNNGEPGPVQTYVVTVQNTSNQPMGPIATASHTTKGGIFSAGSNASNGIKTVAELGNPMALLGEMMDNSTVTDVANSGAPLPSRGRTVARFGPFANGGPALTDTQTFEIDARTTDRLTMASMLIGTNDGFWGLEGVSLPATGSRTYSARAYDAGTEDNDELNQNIDDGASILGPEAITGDGGGRAADNGGTATSPVQAIRAHPGIRGNGDIPNSFRFGGNVARVTISVK